MKSLKLRILLILSTLLLFGAQSSVFAISSYLNLSASTLNVPDTGDTINVTVSSDQSWNCYAESYWYSRLNTSNDSVLTLVVQPNFYKTARTASIEVRTSDSTVVKYITINQAAVSAASFFMLSDSTHSVTASGISKTISVNSNVLYKFADVPAWINLSTNAGYTGSSLSEISLSVYPNNTVESRSASVRIMSADDSEVYQYLTIFQAQGAPSLEVHRFNTNFDSNTNASGAYVQANKTWSAYSNQSWLTTSKYSADSLIFSLQSNPNANSRTATITIYLNDSSATKTIQITQAGSVAAATPTIQGVANTCFGSLTTFRTDPGQSMYNWTVTGGTIVSSANSDSISVVWNTVGVGNVSVNYLSPQGVMSNNSFPNPVNVMPVYNPSVAGLTTPIVGQTASYTTEAGMIWYTWNVDGGIITSGMGTNQINVQWNVAGSHTVQANYTGPNGCASQTPAFYNVNVQSSTPSPYLYVDDSIKQMSAVQGMSYISVNTNSNWTAYSNNAWITLNKASGTLNDSIIFSVSANTGTTAREGLIYVQTTDSTIIRTIQIVQAGVAVRPVPTIAGETSVCQFSRSTYTTEAGQSNYMWTVAGGIIESGANTNSVTIYWTMPGVTTLSVNCTNTQGQSALNPSAMNVTVNPRAAASLGGSTYVVTGQTAIYTTDSGMVDYAWNLTGGSILSGQGTNSINVQWNTLGNQSLQVSYNNTFGCIALSPSTMSVSVVDPKDTISTFIEEEHWDSLSSAAQTSILQIKSNLSWNVYSDSPWLTLSKQSSTGNDSITYTVSANTSTLKREGLITIVAKDSIHILYAKVTQEGMVSPVPTITGATSICQGSTFTYTTEAGQSNYVWTVDGGVILSGAGTNTVSVQWQTAGAKTISVNYANAQGVSALSATVMNISVYPLPVPTIVGSKTVLKNELQTYTTETGQLNYNWNVIGGTIVSGQGTNNISVQWGTIGNQSVLLSYQNASGCSVLSPKAFYVTVQTPASYITAFDSVKYVSDNAQTKFVAIKSNTNWTIRSNAAWITVNKATGMNNDTAFYSVTANTTNTPRVAYLIATTQDSVQLYIQINQAAQAIQTIKYIGCTAGALASLVTNNDKKYLQELNLSGTMNVLDFFFIRDSLKSLQRLNLTNVSIAFYQGMIDSSMFRAASLYTFEANVIPASAFKSNSTIEEVVLPTSLTAIQENAFAQCPSLKSITLSSEPASVIVDSTAFSGTNTAQCKLVVPVGEAESAEQLPTWSLFGSIQEAVITDDDTQIDLCTLMIYPNPVAETLFVKGFGNYADVIIYSMKGEIVLMKYIKTDEKVDMSSLSEKNYLVTIKTEKGVKSQIILKK